MLYQLLASSTQLVPDNLTMHNSLGYLPLDVFLVLYLYLPPSLLPHVTLLFSTCFFFRYTPLHYSAAYNFLDFLEEFIENGATIDIGDQKGARVYFLHSDLLSHSSGHT